MYGWHHEAVGRQNCLKNFKETRMKKLMSLMLGLTLLVGTTVVFADDAPAPKKEKGKKGGKKKKTDDSKKS
jgi:hypothetical protein